MKLRRLQLKYNAQISEEDTNMTNKEKALELINTFVTGDTEKAKELLAPGYIQHNLAYGTGAEAFAGSVAYLAAAPVKTTVNNIRAFEDGDKVFLQTIYNFAGAGEQVASSASMLMARLLNIGTTLLRRLNRIRPVILRLTDMILWKTSTRPRRTAKSSRTSCMT